MVTVVVRMTVMMVVVRMMVTLGTVVVRMVTMVTVVVRMMVMTVMMVTVTLEEEDWGWLNYSLHKFPHPATSCRQPARWVTSVS